MAKTPAPARAPIVSLASTKGGVGKTTIAFLLATEVARRLVKARNSGSPEYRNTGRPARVRCLDADPTRTLSTLVRRAAIPEVDAVETDSDSLLGDLRTAQAEADLVIIDLQGAPNQAMIFACGRSDLVLVPAQPSAFDVAEALRSVGAVRQAADLTGREIPHRIVLSRTPVLRQRVAEHSRNQFAKAGLEILGVEMVQRTAYQQMTYSGRPPYAAEPDGTAAANVSALVDEALGIIGMVLPAANTPAEARA